MKYTVGVDIGATSIRVVAVRGIDSKGYAAVTRVGVAPLREGTIVAGKIKNQIQAAQALVRALEMAGVPRYGFVVGYGGSDMAVTRRQLPASVKPEEYVHAIRTMDMPITPNLTLDESVLCVNPVRTLTSAAGQSVTQLVVSVIKKEEIEDLQKLMLLAGCQPRAIDLSAAGLLRALVRAKTDSNEVATIIDIGETKITVATRQGVHLRSVRVVPGGGSLLTRAIMSQTGETYEEATNRRQILQLGTGVTDMPVALNTAYGEVTPPSSTLSDSHPDNALAEAVERSVTDLIEQIASSIENDASAFGNTLTQGLTITGLSSQIPGLKDRIHQRLGVNVLIGRPWARLENTTNNQPLVAQGGTENPKPLLGLSTAIGLALWKG